jgi:hypothetical protein
VYFYARRKYSPGEALFMKEWQQKLLLALASSLFSLVLGEIAAQVFYYKQNNRWLWSALSEFKVSYAIPVKDRREFTLNPGYRDQSISINELGFRGPLVDPVATQGTPVVCVIGDSVPFGYGVSDSDAYPYILDQLFQGSGKYVRVINAGIPSYTIRQSFDRLWKDVLPRYACNVVVLQAANDFSLLTNYRDDWTPDLTWASMRFKGSWRPSLLQYSAVVTYLDLFMTRGEREKHPYESHQKYPTTRLLAFLEPMLTDQIRLLQAKHIPLVVMPIDLFYYERDPEPRNSHLALMPRWGAHYAVWHENLGEINDLLKNVSQGKDGVYFLDIRAEMRRSLISSTIRRVVRGLWLRDYLIS